MKPGPRRVLVVEDHPDGREALRLLLSVLGYSVEVAGDGAAGIRKALEMNPDAVILDIGLPRLDGCTLARRLRAALGEDVILVAYSAFDPDDLGLAPQDAGLDGWLVKPADLHALQSCLSRRSPARGRVPSTL
jgi:two-component system response regulator MprA